MIERVRFTVTTIPGVFKHFSVDFVEFLYFCGQSFNIKIINH